MNLTDLQVELRTLRGELQTTENRLAALHDEIEKMKPQDKPQLNIDFGRITNVAARKPIVNEELKKAPTVTQKAFLAALAYLTALENASLEDKLYYLCRLAQGCGYATTAEELCKLGMAYAPQDMAALGQQLRGLERVFLVEALVLANLGGPAKREVLGALATVADSFALDNEDVRKLGCVAQAVLRSGKGFATTAEVAQWEMLSSLQVGDIFTFGNYPQSANGAIAPVEWQVLRRDSDGLLVISKYALDVQPYNVEQCNITWSQCTLRKWINSEFINKAFNVAERQQIKEVHLKNTRSYFEDVPDGPDTNDNVFLLSYAEVKDFFADKKQRKCQATDYAQKSMVIFGKRDACDWWLRSPGSCANNAAYVMYDGDIHVIRVDSAAPIAVRPAMKIAL